ncbi:hypothetical protein QQS21_011527 [Conoideocrella luteorostrata]|uniref:BZIP domain-containing protein n=1 Tax=Conoideocrella luteorostrata TaxID=1105319 RepID=A0AAJ0FVT2_9HYPO|nr:hypothetical protein QQS21_011527 [Conoideocrella luteorostrata]
METTREYVAKPDSDALPTGKRARSSDEEDVKPESASFADDDRGKKRSRGRPRLDTKDETAADRRRTQIRLAQRAYRHRKDTAITSLEKRVKELEKANEDVSKEFHDFYGILLSERLIVSSHHAAPRLSSMASNIINVVDKARAANSSEVSGSDDDEERPASGSGNRYSLTASTAAPFQQSSSVPSNVHNESSLAESQQSSALATYTSAVTTATGATTVSAPASAAGPLIHVPPSLNYEVVTAATPQNASFPFYSSMERTAADNFEGSLAPGPSPYGTISVPISYAANELTFGRRLQRQSIESALRLILMLHPPPERFAAVFGFCLLFETRDDIIKRLQIALSRSPFEDLSNWRHPFTNLGGAGTFFESQAAVGTPNNIYGNMPVGNQGTQSYGKPQQMTGMSMGPWGAEVQATRDQRIDYGSDQRMQMMLAGFEGDFFDPDEVETYLRQIGIFIPPRSDFAEAEIDINDLSQQSISPKTGSSFSIAQQAGFENGDSGYGGSAQSTIWTTNSSSSTAGAVDPLCPPSNQSLAQPQVMMAGGSCMGVATPGDFESGTVTYMMPPGGNRMWMQPTNWPPPKTKITLNVTVLIKELSNSSVCLGRTPGVRRKDIGAAIRVAAGLPPSPY